MTLVHRALTAPVLTVLEPEELFPHKSDGEELEAHDLVMHHINPFQAPERFAAKPPIRVVSGHYPYLEQPDAFVTAVTRFAGR